MKYFLREKDKTKAIFEEIRRLVGKEKVRIMHVCGTHEQTIAKYGIRKLLPENVKLVCGPGCPVCVTSSREIDFAVNLAKRKDVILTTFGDMYRTPGSTLSLSDVKTEGANVQVVYGINEAKVLAEKNSSKEIIHFAIGFETTAPSTAIEIIEAAELDNFSIICSHKRILPAMEYLLSSNDIEINAFILPGHVSTITGFEIYEHISQKFKKPCVVAGFEPNDVLLAVLMILRQINQGESKVENEYLRSVKRQGNLIALEKMKKVFKVCDASWRGIGVIKNSGLRLKKKFSKHNAEEKFDIKIGNSIDIKPGCKCAEIMKGKAEPKDCPYFKKVCTPQRPIGACIVSVEGPCNIAYRYGE
ncbi:MAG: hydrogenase formation protein HypD [Candidatus Aenigmarchaeota archaeon]|nr:hydrogenase formation protein HypD [Candidatus Aenigmarchaeota archaeon]